MDHPQSQEVETGPRPGDTAAAAAEVAAAAAAGAGGAVVPCWQEGWGCRRTDGFSEAGRAGRASGEGPARSLGVVVVVGQARSWDRAVAAVGRAHTQGSRHRPAAADMAAGRCTGLQTGVVGLEVLDTVSGEEVVAPEGQAPVGVALAGSLQWVDAGLAAEGHLDRRSERSGSSEDPSAVSWAD